MLGLEVKEEYGELATAVSLTIALLNKCKKNTWSELMASMESADPDTVKGLKSIELTRTQWLLLDRFMPVLEQMSLNPSTTPAVCPACGLYVLTSDLAPTKCLLTAGCTGKPFKPGRAKQAKIEPTQTETEPAEQPEDPTPAPSESLDPVMDSGDDESFLFVDPPAGTTAGEDDPFAD